MTRKRSVLTDVEFVTAWIKASNYEEIVATTGLSRTSIQARAAKLRKAGVKLPKYGRVHKVVDVKGLNELIAKLKK